MQRPGVLSERVRRLADRYPLAVDAGLGLILAAASFLSVRFGPDGQPEPTPHDGGDVIAAAVFFVVFTIRRRWPWLALVVATAGAAMFSLFDSRRWVLLAAITVAVYTIAVRNNRRVAWLAAGSAAIIAYLATVRWPMDSWLEPEHPLILACVGMAAAVGDATRSRREYIAEVEDRALGAEHTRMVEARRQVAEERLHIARELHDVLAHHIAVINVQVGAATFVLEHQPDQVALALGHIRRASDTVLREMAGVVGVLRRPDGLEVDVEPTRGLARLTELLGSLASGGLPVEHHQSGETRELPPMIDLAAYRIIQEALTNAHKHGNGGLARLDVSYTEEGVTIQVTNTMPRRASPPTGSGYGLTGMGERAAAAGGTLTTGPGPDGRFSVRAVLPAPLLGSPPR
jgi:signal transduction histidine kinase